MTPATALGQNVRVRLLVFGLLLIGLLGCGSNGKQAGKDEVVGAVSSALIETPAFVQVNYSCPQDPDSSVSATFDSAQAAGNLNVVALAITDAHARVTAVTDSSGNTYQLAVGPGIQPVDGQQSLRHWMYFAKNIAAASAGTNTITATFDRPGKFPDIRIAEYSGVDPLDPLDAVASGVGYGELSDSGEVATRNANDLLVGANYLWTHAEGPGPGYTSRVIDVPDGSILEDRLVTSLGSYGASAPMPTGGWVMQMVAFRAAGSPASAPDTVAPPAPPNFVATTISDSQIELSWDPSVDNLGPPTYLLERCVGEACADFVEIQTTTDTRFFDSEVLPDLDYRYRVRARDTAGNTGGYSLVAAGAAYTVPAFVQLKSVESGQPETAISAAFDSAQAAGNLNVVAVSIADASSRVTSVTDSAGNSYQLATFVVHDSIGSQAIYYAKGIVAADENRVAVTFDRPAQYPDIRIAEYSGIDPVNPVDAVVGGWASGELGDSGQIVTRNAHDLLIGAGHAFPSVLGPGEGYTFRFGYWGGHFLEDRFVLGLGSYGATVQMSSGEALTQMVAFRAAGSPPSLPDTTAPEPPTNLVTTILSDVQIGLNWDPATDDVGVTTYVIERCTSEDCTDFAEIGTSTGTTFTDSGVLPHTNYRYRVRGRDAAGNEGGYSQLISGTAYVVPAFVQMSSTGAGWLTTTLSAHFGSVQTAGNLNVVAVSIGDTSARVSSITDDAGNSYQLAAFALRETIGWQAIYYAKNIVGPSPEDNWVTVTFDRPTQYPDMRIAEYSGLDPVNPIDVVFSGSASGELADSGQIATRNAHDLLVGAGRVSSFLFGPGEGYSWRFGSWGSTFLEDRFVSELGSYGATAEMSSGDSLTQMVAFRSADSPVSLPDTTPPESPTNVVSTTLSDSKVELTWDPAADDVGATVYVIERCVGAGCTDFVEIGTSTGASFTDSGASAHTDYRYRVRARDAAGNESGYSQPVGGTAYIVPAFVQMSFAGAGWFTSNLSARFESAQTAGNLNVVAVSISDTVARVSSLTDSAGNSYQLAVFTLSQTLGWQAIYYAKNIVAWPAQNLVTVTFDRPTQYPDLRIAEYAGLDPVDPIDVVVSSASSAMSDSGQVATRNAHDLLLGAGRASPFVLGAGDGYRLRFGSWSATFLEDRFVSQLGSYGATANMPSGDALTQMVAFRSADSPASLPDITPPEPPTIVVPTTMSISQIDLNWDPAADNVLATNYEIERCVGADCSDFAVVGSSTSTTFSDTGLTENSTYSYRVRTSDAAGNWSDYSAVVSGTAYVVPVVTQSNDGVAWDDQAAVTASFESAQTAGDLNAIAIAVNDTSTRVSSVTDTAGNVYRLAVGPTLQAGFGSQSIYYAKNIVAAAAGSNVVTVTFDRPARHPDLRVVEYSGIDPSDPIDVVAAARGYSELADSGEVTTRNAHDLLFGAVYVWSFIHGPGEGYTVREVSAFENVVEDRFARSIGSYAATAPLPSGNWVMQMVAFRAAGSPASLPDTTAPSAPENLRATGVSESRIELSWEPAADNVGTTNYRIERCLGVACSYFAEIGTTADSTFEDLGLAVDATYRYRVRGGDAAGNWGDYSAVASGVPQVIPATPTFVQVNDSASHPSATVVSAEYNEPQAAGDLNVIAIGWGELSTQISAVTDSAGNEYQLAVGPTAKSGFGTLAIYYARNIVASPAHANSVTVTFDQPAVNPDLRIAEYSGIEPVDALDVVASATGNGDLSSTGEVTTHNAYDLIVAANFVAQNTLGAGVDFTSRVVSSDGNGLEDRVVSTLGSYSATAPIEAGDWVMQLAAFRAARSPASSDTTPPSAPTNLVATAASSTQITLNWTAASDNVSVSDYLLERCAGADCSDFEPLATVSAVTYADQGLSQGTAFSYRVRARDAAGNSGDYSNTASAVTGTGGCTPGTLAYSETTCDGIDGDCDGLIDENYVPHATACGIGACQAVGASQCLNGVESDVCTPKAQLSATDTTCNGIDENCNGLTDEGYAPHSTQCGIGACSAAGHSECVNGSETNACSPLVPAASDATCNGIDDDCDGQIDEDFAAQPTSCGIGACAAVGTSSCAAGVPHDSCTVGAPQASDATCNGVDDDCDGNVDEDFEVHPSSCGVGACAANGQRECHAGVIVDSCSPGVAQANDSTCNGVDDDCDGQIDEDYVAAATACGVGACAATGSRNCQGGVLKDSCAPGTAAAHDATCNGIDDDCDGLVDEEFQGTATTCAQGACAATGVTSCVNGSISDSCHPGSASASEQTCDGVDGDCDGLVDEDYQSHATTCGVGACHSTGQSSCLGGVEASGCTPKTALAPNDATCDGIDDDCDGQVDEDFSAAPVHCGVGACATQSTPACVNGVPSGQCTPLPAATNDATCDGIDDDCDGQIDEDYLPVATSCGTGACHAAGTTACTAGHVEDDCHAGTPAANDATCNGIDDDCDGQIDENYLSTTVSCGIGACAAQGSTSCSAGHVTEDCTPHAGAASDSVCNGIDDDCDGQVDEDYLGVVVHCGVGVCAATGTTECHSGSVQNQCTPGTAAVSDASCDGLDNDCDGSTDEDFVGLPTQCGVGACGSTGSESCVSGIIVNSCHAGTPAATDSTCNGVDDDCDGQVDEDYASVATSCGTSSCAATGATSCVSGGVVDSCKAGVPGGSDANCNGIDDDCDGLIDEDFLPQQVNCGVGACAATGTSSCSNGHLSNNCNPGTPAADDSTCNGVDDNCNGAVDEGFIATPTVCGVGACHATGTTECAAGSVVDSCVAGHPAANDATCNGIDDDCDGVSDEDFAPVASTCGVGACAHTGNKTCQSGAVVDSCQAGTPAANDASCNGLDDDCDGAVDEDYAAHVTHCGVGKCGASGETSCSAGHEVDSCAATQPAANDASCNGVDDDCDGSIDEEFAVTNTDCGVGACVAHGSTSCTGGHVDDSCHAGTPASSDTTCDGIDDNCNGSVDEGYAVLATSCGVGACKSTGSTSCSAGHVSDSCSAHTAATSDATCDGIDDDCDGSIDENFVATSTGCGVGACGSTGTTSCVAGHLQDSCHPGVGAAQDANCNGVDDDCDGNTDEDFVGSVTHCGVGACAANGATVCVNAQVTNNCQPGNPAPNDASCDGVDDDCDGVPDNDFVVTCSGASVQRCVSGALQTLACDDGNACNGSESCAAGVCKAGTPLPIDDGKVCTADQCQASTGVTHTPLASGVPCGPQKGCDGAGSCVGLPVIEQQPTNFTVAPGQPIVLSVTATGALSYQWRRTGQNIPGATAATYTQTASQADNGVQFTVVVSNSAGSVISAPALVTVQDSAGPALTVDGYAAYTVTKPIVTITGTATDAGSGVALVAVTSDRYPQAIAAVLTPSTGAFSAEVPLKGGDNRLTVLARDVNGNNSVSTLAVKFAVPSLPQIAIVSPVSGSTTSSDLISVSGIVISSLAPSAIRLTLNGDVVFPTGTDGEYQFEFDSVHLLPGQNALTVRAETSEGAVSAQVQVTSGSTTNSPGAGPVIRVTGAQSALYTSAASVTVGGTVSTETCTELITVNGQPATVTGAGTQISFQTSLALSAGDSEVPVTVLARDCAHRESKVEYTIFHDDVAPVITSALPALPAVNPVTTTPYPVAARITEKNLAGVSANDQSLGVLPAGDGLWDVNFSFPLAHGTDGVALIEAWDRAGNRKQYQISLRLDGGVAIEVVAPSAGAQLQSLDPTIALQVVARVPGLPADQVVVALIDGGAPQLLSRADATFSGSFNIPTATASHQLSIQARTSAGQVLAETGVPFSTQNANDIPLVATLAAPLNGASNTEANQVVQVSFNRPIDASKLSVEVTETVHGKGYAELPSGSGLAQFTNVQLVDINRDAAPVPGGVSYLPGDRLVAFYPSRDYGYGGQVSIHVRYNNQELLRGQFGVRKLPTLISGFVADQFFQPLQDIEVQLDGTRVSSVTNSDGVFNFGFGDFSQSISSGRHLLTVNANLANRHYGSIRQYVFTQEGRHRDLGVLRIPLLSDEPFRHVSSGLASANLMSGALVYDFSGAELLFPDGQNNGDVHAQVIMGSAIGVPAQVGVIPFLSYALQPLGVEVAGTVSVDFALPPQDNLSYFDALPDRVLLSGVDSATLSLVPIGVGVIDRLTHRVHSEGRLDLRRLDFLTLTPLPSAPMQSILADYGAGKATLSDLIARLAAAQ